MKAVIVEALAKSKSLNYEKKGSACDGEENFRENGKFPTCKQPIGDGRKQQRNVNIGNAAPAAPPQIRFEIYGLRWWNRDHGNGL